MPRPKRREPNDARTWQLVWPAAPEILGALLAALIALLGRGMPLDVPPQPSVAVGRWLLALLAVVIIVLRPQPSRGGPAGLALVALFAVGLLSLWPRAGGSLAVPLGGELALRLPADLGSGVTELLRLGLLILAWQAAVRVRRGALVVGLVAGVAWLALAAWQDYLPNLLAGDARWRVFAGFINPNQFAAYVVLVIPLCAACWAWTAPDGPVVRWLSAAGLARPALAARVAAGAVLVGALLALGLTGSRGGLLAFGAGLVAAAVALAASGRRRVAAWVGAGLLVAVLLALLGPLRTRFVEMAAQSHSQQFRLLTWGGTWDLVRAYPWLGCGLGGWTLAYGPFARGAFTQHAHHDWLGIWAETGVGGLIALAAFYLLVARAAWRQMARRPALGAAGLASVTAVAVAGLVDTAWAVTSVAGSLVVLGAVLAEPVSAPAPHRSRGWLVAGTLLLILQGCVAVSEVARAAGDYDRAVAWWSGNAAALEQRTAAAVARGPERPARADYARAEALRPFSARLRYRRAAAEERWGRLDEAVAESARGVALSPLNLQSRGQLAALLEAADRPVEALTAYRELDRLATSPALQIRALDFQVDTIHAEALLRLAALTGDAAEAADARARAVPLLEAYLATIDEIEASAGDDRALRAEALAARGLTPEDRARAERLLAEAQASD